MSKGVELIAAERKRQVEVEGWSAEHDAQHMQGELTAAARCYSTYAWWQLNSVCGWTEKQVEEIVLSDMWPWDERWWKPSDDPLRNLVKVGALIAAEIDRLLAEKS